MSPVHNVLRSLYQYLTYQNVSFWDNVRQLWYENLFPSVVCTKLQQDHMDVTFKNPKNEHCCIKLTYSEFTRWNLLCIDVSQEFLMFKNAGCTLFKSNHIFTCCYIFSHAATYFHMLLHIFTCCYIFSWLKTFKLSHGIIVSSKENAFCKFRSCVNEGFVLYHFY